jgi:hypothetical protein
MIVITCLGIAGAEAAAEGGLFDTYFTSEKLGELGVTISEGTTALVSAAVVALPHPLTAAFILWIVVAAVEVQIAHEASRFHFHQYTSLS